MPATKLAAALNAVHWQTNVDFFLKDGPAVDRVSKANLRLAIWAKQFETIEKNNSALCFVREMQVVGHHVAALAALALYKSAAGSIRTVFEAALYYTYFRTHPSELATLSRDSDFYVMKSDLLEYHKTHTKDFADLQNRFQLITKQKNWYSSISSIVHGQIPGAWVEHKSLADIKFIKTTLDLVVEKFCEGEELVHYLFLCTVGRELWPFFTPAAKKLLSFGIAGDTKAALGLDAA